MDNSEKKGLSRDLTSFIFKILHNILPTKKRLFRMNMSNSPMCDLCDSNVEEDLPHALMDCDYNGVVNDWTLAVLFDIDPNLLSAETDSLNMVSLNIPMDPETVLPVLWFLSTVFSYIWKCRTRRKTVTLIQTRTTIEAEVNILKKTKFKQSFELIESEINFVIY